MCTQFNLIICEHIQEVYDEYTMELFQNKTSETLSGYNKWVWPKNES